ncbi:MAG: DUF4287 domain-containing protein [Actinomycetota bacterium]
MAKPETVRKATGRTQDEWYSLLDKWGARGRAYKELSSFLTDKHGMSRWWAQKLIVEYEQDRGIRDPGIRRNGTFEVSASKTVSVPATRLLDAFVDPRQRRRWLVDGGLKLLDSNDSHSAKFSWDRGSSRVIVTVTPKHRAKATVSIAHDRLTDPKQAQLMKAFWRERLSDLKTALETV